MPRAPQAEYESKDQAQDGGAPVAGERNAAQILIVGGGAAGLLQARSRSCGLSSIVLEQDAAIGGTWARRYDRLHLHTIRQLSGLAHLLNTPALPTLRDARPVRALPANLRQEHGASRNNPL